VLRGGRRGERQKEIQFPKLTAATALAAAVAGDDVRLPPADASAGEGERFQREPRRGVG